MSCAGIHKGLAGQSFTFKVTAGPKKVEGFLTSASPASVAAGTTVFTDGQLRIGHTEPLVAGHSYHLVLRRSPAAGPTTVDFTAPNGTVRTCTSAGPVVGTWIVFA